MGEEEELVGSDVLVRSLAADWWCWLRELLLLQDLTLKTPVGERRLETPPSEHSRAGLASLESCGG